MSIGETSGVNKGKNDQQQDLQAKYDAEKAARETAEKELAELRDKLSGNGDSTGGDKTCDCGGNDCKCGNGANGTGGTGANGGTGSASGTGGTGGTGGTSGTGNAGAGTGSGNIYGNSSGNIGGSSIFGLSGTYTNGNLDVDLQTLSDLSNKFYNYTMNVGNMPFGMGSAAMENSVGNWFQAFMACFRPSTTTTSYSIGGTGSFGTGVTGTGSASGTGGTSSTGGTTTTTTTTPVDDLEGAAGDGATGAVTSDASSSTGTADTTGQAEGTATGSVDHPEGTATADKTTSLIDKVTAPAGYEKTNVSGVYKKTGTNEYYQYDDNGMLTTRCNPDGSRYITAGPKSGVSSNDSAPTTPSSKAGNGIPFGYSKTDVDGVLLKDGNYYRYDEKSELLTRCTKDGYTYNPVGTSTQLPNGYEHTNYPGVCKASDSETFYTYDENGNIKSQCYYNGNSLNGYDQTMAGKGYSVVSSKNNIYERNGQYYKVQPNGSLEVCNRDGSKIESQTSSASSGSNVPKGYEATSNPDVFKLGGEYYKKDENGNMIQCNQDGYDASYQPTKYKGVYRTESGESYIVDQKGSGNLVKVSEDTINQMVRSGRLG